MILEVLELCRINSTTLMDMTRIKMDLRQLIEKTILNCMAKDNWDQRSLINEVPAELNAHISACLFQQALNNILGNSLKYTKPDGKIVFRAIELENEIQLGIFDDGLGIEKQHLARIFDLFYKTDLSRHDRNGCGTGLPMGSRHC